METEVKETKEELVVKMVNKLNSVEDIKNMSSDDQLEVHQWIHAFGKIQEQEERMMLIPPLIQVN